MHKNFVTSFKVNLGNTPQRRDFERLRHLSQEQAAKTLGVSLSTFKRKLREFDPRIKWSTKAERQELKKKADKMGNTLEEQLDLQQAELESETAASAYVGNEMSDNNGAVSHPSATTASAQQTLKRKSSSPTTNSAITPPQQQSSLNNLTEQQQMLRNMNTAAASIMPMGSSAEHASLLDSVTMQMQQQRELEERLQLQQQLQKAAQQNAFLQQQQHQLQLHQNRHGNSSDSPSSSPPSTMLGQLTTSFQNTSPPQQQQQQSNPFTGAPQQMNQLALLPPQITHELQTLKTSNFALQQMLANISNDNQRLAGLLNESENIIRELMNMKMQTPIPSIPRYLGDMKSLIGPWSAIAHEDQCAMFISDENTFIIGTNEKFHETLKYTRQEVIHGMKIPRMLVKNVHDENFYISTIKRLYYSGLQTIRGNHTYKGKDSAFNVFDHVVHIETDPRTGSKYAWHELHLLHKSGGNGNPKEVRPIKFSPVFEFDSSKGKRPALEKSDSISDTDFGVEEHFVYSSVNQLVDQIEKKREDARMKLLGVQTQFSSKSTNLNIELEDLSGKSSLSNDALVIADSNKPAMHTTPTTTTRSSSHAAEQQTSAATQQHTSSQAQEAPRSTDSIFADELEGLSPYFGPSVSTPRSPTFSFDLSLDSGDNGRPRKRQKTNHNDFQL
uniref:PAS domain-containing protein n=1 Tax=Percolomonas cosmopolitus TaxID=63605 RepID=A0A7S1KL00_9EUKA|mmetsp:Transcript_10264/g.38110  ORF Transcript_10264/g.38110 Transcript_10264/m.38110 type:complete len:670 (+) Transcript_10264:766-2775(+)|eukprot:CAMPEP_0117439536 /NCGR_PEP_ID=MMETSP0759-20121206/2615_1 /TAXON_ID=63605 /ORGANISM="Percolomonas cosmopolitus, Strain WS" /LENGTH=669 /DNA_ID=CAMNT_0005231253 /DNA_START=746 /DNA_END=2755 /DNA_ORIENTATION=-